MWATYDKVEASLIELKIDRSARSFDRHHYNIAYAYQNVDYKNTFETANFISGNKFQIIVNPNNPMEISAPLNFMDFALYIITFGLMGIGSIFYGIRGLKNKNQYTITKAVDITELKRRF